ncbi:F-box protein At5g49610-like [Rhododendron vialii]|uniref:F-box protein At5g49610-like n=1 Tax=Rhododendron vialii TaxID=182163 RepID=UPI00265E63E2|nr:F-box protein At5g49610-like [Rhododendron vialii]
MENEATAIEGMELLTEDVLMEILSRLSVKSLLRCKSVSKNWYSLIRNPSFISLHHTRAQPHDCISLVRTDNNYTHHWFYYLFPGQTSIQHLDLSFTERPVDLSSFRIRGSCNGLMCLSEWFKANIMICNPATREFRLLPRPPYHNWRTNHVGFAFDSKTNDYIVVRVATLYEFSKAVDMDFEPPTRFDQKVMDLETPTRIDHKIQIYGMSRDSWKEIAATVPNHRFSPYDHPSTLMDGVFYWLCYDFSIEVCAIDVLNTVEGSFKQRALPVSIGSASRPNICLLNDSLVLVVPMYDNQLEETQFDVWLMKEYRVQECWTKKYTIGPILGNQRPFGFRPNSEVLLTGCKNGQMVSYNLSTGDIKEYKQLCDLQGLQYIAQVFPYSENLVSVKRRSS